MEEVDSLKYKTAKKFLVGGFSNGLQQVIGAIFGVFLARLLTPADYGMVAMITIFSVIASSIQESGLISGIANKKTVGKEDYNAAFWFSISISGVIYFILFFSAPLIAAYFETPALTNLSRLCFLSFLISSFSIAPNAYLYRNLKVKERAIAAMSGMIIANSVAIIMAYYGFAYWGLAVQTVVYSIVTTILFWKFSGFKPYFSYNLNPIKDLFGYSSKIIISNVFLQVNNHIFSLILGKYYTPKDVGNVTQANKWSLMAQSVLTGMVGTITQPILNQVSSSEERKTRVFRKILAFTSFIAFPALFCLSLISKEFTLIVLGAKWINSIFYMQVFFIGGAFLIVSSVFSNFILSTGKSNIYMWSLISYGILQITILLLCKPFGIETMALTACSLQISWLFVWFLFSKKHVKYTFGNLSFDIFTYAAMAACAVALSYLISSFIENIYISIFVKIICSFTIYALLNRVFLPTILLELIDNLKKIKQNR